ncbi:unnamed protein product [Cochlearia groenlandica]
MVFLTWGRPSSEQQQQVINKTGTFNYDNKYRGCSSKSISKLKEDEQVNKDGFLINHSRVLVGSGLDSFNKGKKALQHWKHFGMDWSFVDPKTPIETGKNFCICVKEVLPWVMLPLQVVYVDNESKKTRKDGHKHFGYGSGTLQGHLLAGEERFSIELDGDGKVWYEICSFSKPAHFLSFLGYPYVKLRQKHFAHCSSDAILKHINDSS